MRTPSLIMKGIVKERKMLQLFPAMICNEEVPTSEELSCNSASFAAEPSVILNSCDVDMGVSSTWKIKSLVTQKLKFFQIYIQVLYFIRQYGTPFEVLGITRKV